jgi:hypothetical protein
MVPGRPRHRATGTPLLTGAAPNDPLVRRFQEPAPAKAGGEFKLGNGRYCEGSDGEVLAG